MTYKAAQEKAQDLKQMGLTRQGLKKGSRLAPLVLVVLVLLVFISSLVDTEPLRPLEQLILTQHKETQAAGGRKADVCTTEKDARKDGVKSGVEQEARRDRGGKHIDKGNKLLAEGSDASIAAAKEEFRQAVSEDPCAAKQIGEIWHLAHYVRGRKLQVDRDKKLQEQGIADAERKKFEADQKKQEADQRKLQADHKKLEADQKKLSPVLASKDAKEAAPQTDLAARIAGLIEDARKAGERANAAKAAAERANERAGVFAGEAARLDDDADKEFDRARKRYLALMPDALHEHFKDRSISGIAELFLPFGVKVRGDVQRVLGDFVGITVTGLKTVVWLVVFSLAAGIAGLIYRRAFWLWFVLAFALLSAIIVAGEFGSVSDARLTGSEPLYLLVFSQLVLLGLAFRLRRHSTGNTKEPRLSPRLYNAFLVALLAVVGIVLLGASSIESRTELSKLWPGLSTIPWLEDLEAETISLVIWNIILIVLPTLYLLFRRRVAWSGREPKNIVVCLDGTWNTPGMTDFGHLTQTNVYKLFKALQEDEPHNKVVAKLKRANAMFDASICKRYQNRQVAFYYSGVGNKLENSEIGQLLGGATGMGAAGIVERAYLDVMRVSRPGDRLFIFGFSRGAAIARLLARAIDQRGAPRRMWTLRLLGRHWVLWKSRRDTYELPIAVLGCWDTVGSFGVAKTMAGINFQKIDLFKDLTVPNNVVQAYHMVALDETRDAFEPTLMDPDPINPGRIVEVWFAGNHANIGGGYATDKLSDITLDFLLRHVSSGYAYTDMMEPGDEAWGIYLRAKRQRKIEGTVDDETDLVIVDPDPLGQLRASAGMLYNLQPRNAPLHAVISDTVFARMKEAVPVYAPQALFNFNAELANKRATIETEVNKLWETKSLDDAERDRILTWSRQNLSLTKWMSDVPAGSSRTVLTAPENGLDNDGFRGQPA